MGSEPIGDTDSKEAPQIPEETVPYVEEGLPDVSEQATDDMIPAGGNVPNQGGTPEENPDPGVVEQNTGDEQDTDNAKNAENAEGGDEAEAAEAEVNP